MKNILKKYNRIAYQELNLVSNIYIFQMLINTNK